MRMHQDGLQTEILNQDLIQDLHPGKSGQEIQGTWVTDMRPPEIAHERIQLAQRALATGEIQRQEYSFWIQEKICYEEARIQPLGGDEVLVVIRDITQQKQAELDLKQTKEQLELFIHATSEGFWDWDLITGEIYFSSHWKEMLGYRDHELTNTLQTWESLILEADRSALLQLLEDYRRGRIDRFSTTQRFCHKDGSIVHILSRAIQLKNESGEVVRIVGSHLDVTPTIEMQEALKVSEMQLAGVLNSSLDGIMAFRSVRQQGQIVDFEWLLCNPAACEVVGRSAEQLIGKRMLEELPGNREEGLFDLYVQVVNSGDPVQRQFYYDHDGIDCWFENIAVKLGDGFAVTFRDITEIKQSETALQQANLQLEGRVGDLKQRNVEMMLLSEMSEFLQACLTIEEACAAITCLVDPLFPDCSGGIFITSASRNRVESVASWGNQLKSEKSFAPKACWGLRRGRSHTVVQERSGLRCNHVSAKAEVFTTLCIPMIAQGETLGLLHLSAENAEALPESKQQLARTVAEQIALALANLHLRETLQHQSIRDPLTGLFNRRYLEESLNQEVARSQRHKHPIGIIMLDVDHFKRFNDTYGHDAGDLVLQAVGQLLRDITRDSDLACRYGGEEMILVLPESSLAETQTKAERIRQAISQMSLTHQDHLLENLTISLGVACLPQHGKTSTAVIQAADTALYKAKALGRNQVIAAS
ncbi:MAG: diguanylate cyclase [Leptolyngbya sp. SIO4C5]|nr:diguanylate cyclase [Leptolyngbya sp. SIO4C5]